MLVSCKYCGRIHERKFECEPKKKEIEEQKQKRIKKFKKKKNYINSFRCTKAWTNKSIEIRKRDLYLCQICIRKKYNYKNQYENNKLSVHHIIPIHEDYNKRLDNNNLITLCDMHHQMAEDGYIPRDELLLIVKEQENEL